jgi:hypothetical protein
MTEKEAQIRMTMFEAFRALWPILFIVVGIFGSVVFAIYARAEFAVALARETEKQVVADYVCKDDYRYDINAINNKLDYLIQMHMEGKK